MLDQRPAVSVIAAVHDEAVNVEELVQRIRTTMERESLPFEIILVDDGSDDATVTILRRLEADDEHLRVYELTRNFGQNAALVCGLFAARGDTLLTLDGDLQNPPEEIPKLLAALGNASIVTGCRATRHEPFARWVASRCLHWLACWAVGVSIEDFGGNFKAYQRQVIEEARKSWAPPKHFFTTALQLGFPVKEVTVRHDPRRHGQSQYQFASAVASNMSHLVAHTTLPLLALGVLGALGMLIGTAGVTMCWWARDPHWLTCATFLTLSATSAPLFATGVLGLYLGHILHRGVGGLPSYVVKEGPRRDAA